MHHIVLSSLNAPHCAIRNRNAPHCAIFLNAPHCAIFLNAQHCAIFYLNAPHFPQLALVCELVLRDCPLKPRSHQETPHPMHDWYSKYIFHLKYLTYFLSWKCSCLMAEVWLKPNPNRSDIAWVSFDLQEHKTHNNAALVMDHLSLLWSKYQEYGIPNAIPTLPTYVGGKTWGREIINAP